MAYETLKFAKGDVIFKRGDIQFFFYEIVTGSVNIINDFGESSETVLVEMKPGQTFGEMSILDYSPRSATAVAAADVELIKIDDDNFEEYIREDHQRLIVIMRQLSNRTRELTEDYNEALRTVADIKAENKHEGFFANILKFANVWRKSGSKA